MKVSFDAIHVPTLKPDILTHKLERLSPEKQVKWGYYSAIGDPIVNHILDNPVTFHPVNFGEQLSKITGIAGEPLQVIEDFAEKYHLNDPNKELRDNAYEEGVKEYGIENFDKIYTETQGGDRLYDLQEGKTNVSGEPVTFTDELKTAKEKWWKEDVSGSK